MKPIDYVGRVVEVVDDEGRSIMRGLVIACRHKGTGRMLEVSGGQRRLETTADRLRLSPEALPEPVKV